MSESDTYIALGPAERGFETYATSLDYGVNACGNRCGVFGSAGSEFGREIVIVGVGVWGDGAVDGVHGRGSFKVKDSVGVRGEGSRSGVVGSSARGRGGEFHSDRAQIRLVPPNDAPPQLGNIGDLLPADGQTGDLFALPTDRWSATLWFCERGALKDGGQTTNALWKQVVLGNAVTGQKNLR